MSPIFFVIIIIAAIAAVIGFVVWNAQMKGKRRKEMAAWAQAYGPKFLSEKDHSVWLRYQLFKCRFARTPHTSRGSPVSRQFQNTNAPMFKPETQRHTVLVI